jgi:hypothetical protein
MKKEIEDLKDYQVIGRTLAAVVNTDVRDPDGGEDTLFFLIYSDGSMRVKFPSGRSLDVGPKDESTDMMQEAIRAATIYSVGVGGPLPQCAVYVAPEGLEEDGEKLAAWMRGIGLEVIFHEAKTA